jgi:hypothetical protein
MVINSGFGWSRYMNARFGHDFSFKDSPQRWAVFRMLLTDQQTFDKTRALGFKTLPAMQDNSGPATVSDA